MSQQEQARSASQIVERGQSVNCYCAGGTTLRTKELTTSELALEAVTNDPATATSALGSSLQQNMAVNKSRRQPLVTISIKSLSEPD